MRAHVPPVARLLIVDVPEIVGDHAGLFERTGNHVPAEIVRGRRILGIFMQPPQQDVGVEDVDPHGGADHLRIENRAGGVAVPRLFLEAHDPVAGVDLGDAEALGFGWRDLDRGDRDIRVVPVVPVHHLAVVHFVDLVGGQDQRQWGLLHDDALAVLEDRVGRPQVPVVPQALHGRNGFDELAQLRRQDVPAVADVPDQVQRFVLC